MTNNQFSWWYKVDKKQRDRRERGDIYDHMMNRIEKERHNAARMGLQLVIEASPSSESYTLYTTPSVEGGEVLLFGTRGSVTVNRDTIFQNGDYYWTNHVSCSLPVVQEDDMECFN